MKETPKQREVADPFDVQSVVRRFKRRLPADVTVEQFERMVADALVKGTGLTWIPWLLDHHEKCNG